MTSAGIGIHEKYFGNIFMVIAPSGAGKSTLVSALLAQDSQISLSVSCTTRPPRSNEKEGINYYFISIEEFQCRKKSGEFLESAKVHGNYYATSRLLIEEHMRKKGKDVLLEIDWQGALQVRKHFANAIGIFILPPSIDALEKRLKSRGTDECSVINRRLLAAGREMAHAPEADFIVINEDFQRALSDLQAVVTSTRLHFDSQRERHEKLFIELGIHSLTSETNF
ncbi:guanylate kinase [Candidatus Pandoraea novymonadis]|uniref:Guanylate kinase n=1 Tax=Candidatus Pandoraea novymonadis TaxID=1808959 RepID=A0ABX5FE94_9BURK|nr:guanylate kinase [Candidatus Pandoraea novymonadis]PSB91991.1 Guanylate kinase [Candidatus Pandoraea novymonadis]